MEADKITQLDEALAFIRKQDERIEYLEDMVESLVCTLKVCCGGGCCLI
jgi:hypothetical protein